MRKQLLIVLFGLILGANSGVAEIKIPSKMRCPSASSIRALIDGVAGAGKFEYAVLALSGTSLKTAIEQGRYVSLPVIGRKGALSTWKTKGKSVSYRDPDLHYGYLTESFTDPGQAITLSSESTYKFGCSSATQPFNCGSITFLDSNGSKFEGLFFSQSAGTWAIESAESLIANLTGAPVTLPDKCMVAYNANAIPFFDIDGDFGETATTIVSPGTKHVSTRAIVEREIRIHLDGGLGFYDIDPDTWHTRMQSLTGGVNLVYSVIEPITGKKFKVTLRPRSLQAWLPGSEHNGALTATDIDTLTDQVNDPAYRANVQQEKNQLFYHFVGYDIDGGNAGKAGSICGTGDDDFGDDVAFQRTRAVGQQIPDADGGYEFATFVGRVVVMAHELGHVLGGKHQHGALQTCAGGRLPNLCGCTIMLSGAAGGLDPDDRKLFFSRRNDLNIQACLNEAD